jgi:CheY-like chemotaxis protein
VKLLLVEDDPDQVIELELELTKRFRDLTIEKIATEHKFRERCAAIAASPPKLVIMDVMLRWTVPAKEMPPEPDDVKKDQFYRAGFRCVKLLHELNANIPVILFSVIDREDLSDLLALLPGNVRYVRKQSDAENLFAAIVQLTRKRKRRRRKPVA